ncbi:MAG: hypothetical protein JNN07_24100 [Verrucomicrobiales bacterium]|nr:hypothetical protein [Verrucomicrobiales bacterium]
MNPTLNRFTRWDTAVLLGCLLGVLPASAFPPAPHHTLYGMVRNQYGEPLNITLGEVFLETASGSPLRCQIVEGLGDGFNYRLEVPMDSGTVPGLYKPTALLPATAFRLKVQIGQTTYLPMEMVGNLARIGEPALQTRLDLTLGVDSDGDGLPDAWEQAVIAVHGGTLASIKPDGDGDGDGISNLAEYLAGTSAFDPTDGFRLTLIDVGSGATTLEFLTMPRRTYTIHGSTDLAQWKPVKFTLASEPAGSPLRADFYSNEVVLLRVSVPFEEGTSNRFFKAKLE